MQAIETKFLPATNFKGARIKATCERGSVTIGYPHELNQENAHIKAAQTLVDKFIKEDAKRYGTNRNPWSTPRVVGETRNKFIHVFVK